MLQARGELLQHGAGRVLRAVVAGEDLVVEPGRGEDLAGLRDHRAYGRLLVEGREAHREPGQRGRGVAHGPAASSTIPPRRPSASCAASRMRTTRSPAVASDS